LPYKKQSLPMHFFGKIGLVLLKDLIISRITKIHLIVTKRHKNM